jgi:hypothetical protein
MTFTAISLSARARLSAGFPFRGAIDALPAGDVAVIQMRNIEGELINWSSLTRVSLPTKRAVEFLASGDVIFTTRGRRNFAVALEDVPSPAVCSPHFFVMQSREPDKLLPAFLAWQINQKPAQDYLQQAATGSHILNITRAAIEGLPLALPPVEVQHALLELASAARHERHFLNALIDNRQRQLDAVSAKILISERLPA